LLTLRTIAIDITPAFIESMASGQRGQRPSSVVGTVVGEEGNGCFVCIHLHSNYSPRSTRDESRNQQHSSTDHHCHDKAADGIEHVCISTCILRVEWMHSTVFILRYKH